MADKIRLEEAQAKMWIADVKNEINIIDGILKKAARAMTEVPGDDDTIYQGIRIITNTLTNVWTRMINGFRQASESIETGIKNTAAAGEELVQEGENLNKRMGV